MLNAANEEAVEQFLAGRIGFLEIARIVETVLEEMAGVGISTLDDVREADRAARVHARAAQAAPAGG